MAGGVWKKGVQVITRCTGRGIGTQPSSVRRRRSWCCAQYRRSSAQMVPVC